MVLQALATTTLEISHHHLLEDLDHRVVVKEEAMVALVAHSVAHLEVEEEEVEEEEEVVAAAVVVVVAVVEDEVRWSKVGADQISKQEMN